MSKRVIFFDIGATLIEGPDRTPAKAARAAFDLDEATARRLDRTILTEPMKSEAVFAKRLAELCGLAENAVESVARDIWTSQLEGPRPIPGARDLLAALGRMDVTVGFISNIWAPYAASFDRLFPFTREWPRFFSFRLGYAKPDEALYRAALSGLAARPDQCVMVGDSITKDIEPAHAVGMRTAWVRHRPTKEEEDLDEARRRGIHPGRQFDHVGRIDPTELIDWVLA